MKLIKMLGPWALVVAATMAFAASASAVNTTAPEGTQYTGTFHLESEGHFILHGPAGSGIKLECNSTIHGEKLETVSGVTRGKVNAWTFAPCTGGTVHAITEPGELLIHSAGSENGTLTSTGAKVSATVSSIFGVINCIFTTNSTVLGTLTGATNTAGTTHATLDIAATIPRTGGSGLCGSSAQATGSYKVGTPTGLTIDPLGSVVNTTAPEGSQYTGTFHLESEGHLTFHGPSGTGINIVCSSTIHGEKLETNSKGITRAKIKTTTFTPCTGATFHAITEPGELIIHSAGSGNGTVTSAGAKWSSTWNTGFGIINCVYTTNATDIGTLTGATNTSGKTHATLDIAATIPRTEGSGFCGSSAQLTGTFIVNTPTGLTIT